MMNYIKLETEWPSLFSPRVSKMLTLCCYTAT